MHPPYAVLLLPYPPLGNNYCSGLQDVLESRNYGDPSLQADGAQTIFDLARPVDALYDADAQDHFV